MVNVRSYPLVRDPEVRSKGDYLLGLHHLEEEVLELGEEPAFRYAVDQLMRQRVVDDPGDDLGDGVERDDM